MASPRLDRKTLSKCNMNDLLRLAKFVKINIPDNCICDKCKHDLIEVLIRKLDSESSWPPPLSHRNW